LSPSLLRTIVLGLLLSLAMPGAGAAQYGGPGGARELERYGATTPEGRLMAFYSSALAFSPVGLPPAWRKWSLSLGIEASYVPPLSESQRTAGFDKPEATNLAPLFPRPRAMLALPGGFVVEGSWVPPIRMFDVEANLVSVALSRPLTRVRSFEVVPRVSMLGGRVRGPITCNAETADDGGDDLRLYYQSICHGNDSDDHFEPRHISAEVMVATSMRGGAFRPYLSAGARRERTKFDIGVIRADGSRDLDHPVLELRATRAHFTGGLMWLNTRRLRTAAEAYWAPGSLFTVRALAGVQVW